MEKKITSPLEREDRENDLDDYVFGSMPGVLDYDTFLKKSSGEVIDDETNDSVGSKIKKKGGSAKTEDLKNRLGLTLFLSEDIKMFLKIAAAKDSKSLAGYVTDLIIKDLRKRKKEIITFITTGLDKDIHD